MADGLDPERVRWALAHPAYGPWLRALVHDVSGYNATGADEYLWKEEDEPRIRELVDEALGHEAAEVELADVEPDLSGKPLPAVATLRALRAYASKTSIQQVAKDKDIALSFRGARRVYSWVDSGAVWWDRTQQKVRVAAGYSLIRDGTKARPTLQLIRV